VPAVLVTAAVGAVGGYAVAGDCTAGGSDDRASSAGSGPGGQAPEAAQDAASGEQWRGTLRVDSNGMELDAEPPGKGSSMLGSDIAVASIGSLEAFAGGGGLVAQWQNAEKEPGRADCAALTDTVGSGRAPVRQGTVLCVRTNEGRVARLTVTNLVGDISPAAEVDAVVWRLTR
jgi:hypothetical protein